MDFRIFVGVSGLIMSLSIHGWVQTAPSDVPLAAIPAEEITNALEAAPAREGPAPETPDGVPHRQLNQNAPVILQEALMASVTALPGVRIEPTQFSLDGSKGWRLVESLAQGPEEAFINGSLEFGHLHRPDDGSMHLLLPTDVSIKSLEKGWGILHPLSGYPGLSGDNSSYIMIYGPRDESELKTIWTISQISYYFARGLSMAPSTAITPATWG